MWPRLGDDRVDASTLPDSVAMTVLGDAGDDVVLFGGGPDFFNGFTGDVEQICETYLDKRLKGAGEPRKLAFAR